MTVTIPNYQIERNEPTLIEINEHLYVERMHTKEHRVLVRNTMHGLTLVESGHKKVEINGDTVTIGAQQAVLFAQGNYFSNQNSPDYRALSFFFDDVFLHDFLKRYSIDIHTPPKQISIVGYEACGNIQRLLDSMTETHSKKTPMQTILLSQQFELLLLELLQHFPDATKAFFSHIGATSKERMRFILEANLDIIGSVEQMQKLLRMSPSQFHKAFQKQFGTSPKTWLDAQRMQKATFLLLHSDKSIAQIAAECGYSTSSWFIARFKEHYKSTPKSYREENRYK